MQWNSAELAFARGTAADLCGHRISRQARPSTDRLVFSPDEAADLVYGIRESKAVRPANFLPVRHLYRLLGLDEHHAFRWRLEHKLVQALILNHFCPQSVPVTNGLSRYIYDNGHRLDQHQLRERLCSDYVKPALGSGSDRDNTSSTENAIRHLSGIDSPLRDPTDERWVVQERIPIVDEYRVHSIEDSVVPDLTYHRHSNRTVRAECDGPNQYVSSLIDRLPSAFMANSLCGWDIARTAADRYVVVEVNFGGYHPVVEPGFQCSGFLVEPTWGPYVVARLLRFVEKKYQVTIAHVLGPWRGDEIGLLYYWVSCFHTLLRISALIMDLSTQMKSAPECATIQNGGANYAACQRFISTVLAALKRVMGTIG